MKITCKIIEDLMPLCCEGLASPESEALVRDHLETCPACRRRYEAMQTPISATAEVTPMKAVRTGLVRRRRTAVLFAVSLAVLLLVTVFAHLTEPVYLDRPAAAVTAQEDGALRLSFGTENVTACRVSQEEIEGVQCAVVTAWTSAWDRLLHAAAPTVTLPAGTEAVLYSVDDQETVLLWGRDPLPDGGLIVLPRLVLGYYALLFAGLAAVLTVLAAALRRTKAGPVLACLALIPWAALLSHLCIKGFSTLSSSLMRDLLLMLPAALAAYGCLFSGLCMLRQRRT